MCNVNTEFVANLKEKMNKILDEASESKGMDKTRRGVGAGDQWIKPGAGRYRHVLHTM